jgi:hypothetical protein
VADYRSLTGEQVEHFLERGYIVLRDCVSPEAVTRYTQTIWTRLGYRRDAPATWARPSVHMPAHRGIDVRQIAPRAWEAACDLVGGAGRISTDQPYTWNDSFIVNLGEGADRAFAPASPQAPGWHKDGDFFRHFLDSPEQGLLTLVLWSDVRHRGGATFVAADSVAPVARYLAEHPEGAYPPEVPAPRPPTLPEPARFRWDELVAGCTDFAEATGAAGDVYLLHPFILHAKSQNTLRAPRVITNPALTLAEPMNFDRADPGDHSLVERAVLRALGTARYRFTRAGPRERLAPQREADQREMRERERERLAAAGYL